MAQTEYLLFGFSYHRMGQTNRWRPGGSTLGRSAPEQVGTDPLVRLGQHSEHIVWIDVYTERPPEQGIDELSHSCETLADAEFRRLFPDAELCATR
jgi:hypothetical protein